MGKRVKGAEALELLYLLEQIDNGKPLTPEIKQELDQITELCVIDINLNQKIDHIPSSIEYLTNLQKLDIHWNNLTFLPKCIGKLSKLQELNISGNELTTLPHSLGNLSNLHTLDISFNKLTTLPHSLGNLSNLHTLDISFNKLTTLRDSLRNLSKLQKLYVNKNKLTNLLGIDKLSNLQVLYVNDNKLTNLLGIGKLSNLQVLDISGNELTTLPHSLGNLSNLQALDMGHTAIQIIPSWIRSFKHLKILDLSGLHLRGLPPEILELNLPFYFSESDIHKIYRDDSIILEGTTLSTQPISLFQQPTELIQAYFDSYKIPVHATKVIFLGDGGAGKTHTIHRIQNDCKPGEYNTKMTPGVEITSFQTKNKDLYLNFWDFGGQEIMPSIHRCFLTKRALYVIVVSTRTGNLTAQARHWLKTIDAFAPGAPVLIAVNCWDDTTSAGVNNELLYNEFPNMLQTVIFSAKCSTKEQFYQTLLFPIEEHARNMDSYSMELPESWFHIEQELREQKESYISGDDYLQICRDNGLEDEQIAQWLLEWFNDMGVCFSYSDDNGQPYQVLRPEWLTNAVYRILLDEQEPNSDGIVRKKYIERSLTNAGSGTIPEITYTSEECNAILAVMIKFRLAYPIKETELFIPALCTEKMPALSLPENCEQRLEYELKYSYLPDCVVHQLMIWYLENGITPKHVWRSGLCVQQMERWAVIKSNARNATLRIQLYIQPDSFAQNCHNMLRNIYRAVQEIHTRLSLEATDCIVMHEGNQTAHFPLGPLLEAKKKGWKELPSLEDGEFHVYNIDQILDSAFDSRQVQAATEQDFRYNHSKINAGAIYNITNNYTNSNNTTNHQYGWTADEAQAFANAILERQNLFTEEVMAKLMDYLSQQNEPELQKLSQELVKSKSPFERLKSFVSDAAKMGKDAQTLYKLGKAIYTIAPTVLEGLQTFLPHFSM